MKKLSKLGIALFASALVFAFAGCQGGIVESYQTQTPAASTAADDGTADESSAEEEPSEEESSEEESSEEESSEEESSEEESSEEESSEDESSEEESSEQESSAEESSEAPKADDNVKDYIYFDNSETKWEKVSAYWWNDQYSEITNKITGELYPANGEDGTQNLKNSWPGVELEKIEGTDIYRCAVPVGATKIIFNSGVPDVEVRAGAEGYQSVDLKFSETDNAGQVYAIDTSVEPTAGKGKEKTKFTYGAGTWSDYSAE